MKPIQIAFGNGSMLAESEDFVNGYQAGHLACMLDRRAFAASDYVLTNETLTAIMMEKLESIEYKEQYSVGYCVGWIATFATKGNLAQKKC